MSLLLQVTGTYSDASTADINQITTFQISDNSIAFIEGDGGNVYLTPDSAGKIWGATIGLTATLAPAPSVATSIHVVALDSGTFPVGSNVWGYPKMPQLSTHWQAIGISPWGTWFGCQELTGNLAGSGSSPFTLTAAAGGGIGVQYGQSPAGGGWLRTGLMISGTASQRITAASGTGPNVQTSFAMLGYISLAPGPANQAIFGIPSTTASARRYFSNNTVAYSGVINAGFANVTFQPICGNVPARHTDRVHPYLFVHTWNNSTLSGSTFIATDICWFASGGIDDRLTVDDIKGLSNISTNASLSSSVFFMAFCTGSVAESYASISGSGDLLSRLGWVPEWKDASIDSGTIKMPTAPEHWQRLGYQAWTAYSCQDLNSPIGTTAKWEGVSQTAYNLVSAGSVTYGNTVPNWKRKGLGITETVSQKFQAVVANQQLFDPTGSFAAFCIAVPQGSTGAKHSMFGIGNTSNPNTTAFSLDLLTTGKVANFCAGATATSSLAYMDGPAHGFMIVYDKTNSRAKFYTELEKVTGSFNAIGLAANLTASVGLGGITATTPASGTYLYFAFCTGTIAESFSDDGRASKFYKDLGWLATPW